MMITKYKNGNTLTSIFSDGTKIREYENTPVVEFPESIDVKITNYCDLGCEYCHEVSTTEGLHGDLTKLLQVLEDLPEGVELAIGGGNPLSHPDLKSFLLLAKSRGWICNLTVNQGHILRYKEMLLDLISNELVKGVGVSITSNNLKPLEWIASVCDHVVWHVIAGVNKVNILDTLIPLSDKVLVLGYKHYGLGVKYFNDTVTKNLNQWFMYLPSYLGKCVVSFDNLAIEQLKIKRLFTEEGWNKFYMGDDFAFTMYLDAVKQEYAPTSRSDNRTKFSGIPLLDYFQEKRCYNI